MKVRGGIATTFAGVLVFGGCSSGYVEGLSAPPGYPKPGGHGAALEEVTEKSDPSTRAGRGTQWQGSRRDEEKLRPLTAAGRGTQWGDYQGTELMELLDHSESLGAFTRALKRTGMDAELEEKGPFTVFAPIDFAFQQTSLEYLADLFGPNGDERLRDLVRRHIVVGEYSEEDLVKAGEVTSLAGTKISVRDIGGLPEPGGAQVLAARQTRSGTVLQVDRLIEP